MKTKTTLAALCLALSSLTARTQTNRVTLQGTAIHFNNQIQVQDMSEFKALNLPDNERTFVPDANGHFKLSFDLAQPDYFRVGRNILYLSPGDDLTVRLDYNDPVLGEFSGKGAEANLYLTKTPFPHAGSYLDAGTKLHDDVQASVDYIIETGKNREKVLSKLKNVSPEFKKLETARIKADMLNSMLMMRTYMPYTRHYDAGQKASFMLEHLRIVTPLKVQYAKDLIDPDYLKIEVFSQIAQEIMSPQDQSPNAQKVRDWINAADVASKIQHMSSKDEVLAMKPQIDAIADPAYRQAVTQTYNSLTKFGNGDKAVDFNMLTTDGKEVHLSDFMGKVIFVDLWATWCGPCLQEMPHFAALKEKYKNDPNVVFVSLSIDDDNTAWKRKLSELKANGVQVIVDRAKLKDYSVIDIPRTIVIDKNFKIAAMKGYLPSNKQTEGLINNLLLAKD